MEQYDHELRVKLRWTTQQLALTASNACIYHVKGLSSANKQLLVQRGATKRARDKFLHRIHNRIETHLPVVLTRIRNDFLHPRDFGLHL